MRDYGLKPGVIQVDAINSSSSSVDACRRRGSTAESTPERGCHLMLPATPSPARF